MKPFRWICALIMVALAGYASAAKPRPHKAATAPAPLAEELKAFDDNGNGLIEPDELAAVQKTFAGLSKLDKNGDRQIDQTEVPQPPAVKRKRGTDRSASLKAADKNGNRKIDPDEVAELQKSHPGGAGKRLARIDRNGNGKLEGEEIDRLNQRLRQRRGGGGKSPAASTPLSQPKLPAKAAKPGAAPESKPEAEPEALKPSVKAPPPKTAEPPSAKPAVKAPPPKTAEPESAPAPAKEP